MSRGSKRPTSSYVESAKNLAHLVPSLRKYKRRKTLSPQQKGAITRAEKKLRKAYNLKPVNKKIARDLKGMTYAPGVRAIQLNGISPHARLRKVKKNIYMISNGRTWILMKLPQVDKDELEDMAEDIFNTPLDEMLDLERLEELAKKAFARPDVKEVHLWTKQGIVGDAFHTLNEFIRWLYKKWSEYQSQEFWINGLAVWID